MTPIPTLHLRFVEHTETDPENSTHEYCATKQVRILQQFWEHADGDECAGDMFVLKRGTWRDVPVVEGGAA